MRAAVMYGAGDVRVEDRPDPKIRQPTDAVVRVLRAAICGSDLHPYHSMPPTDQGRPMGHEFLGVVEDVGSQVAGLKAGDLVITPFTWADNTCNFCRKGLHTSCRHGGRYGFDGVAKIRELSGGDGIDKVIECVGTSQALETAFGAVIDGGVVSRLGVPQYQEGPIGRAMLLRSITLTGGAAPARAYIEKLMPVILDGTIEPGRVFDRTVSVDQVPDGYRAMAGRDALKVLIRN